ncbi:MAG: YicC/YloC family endoribonuclease [Oscillospiraceae bacterium]
MINSMTGFGRAQQVLHGREITVELRSVNHRYLEINSRVPRSYSYIEDRLKPFIQTRVSRCKMDIGITVVNCEGTDAKIELNMNLAKGYADAIAKISSELGLDGSLSAVTLSRFPDVFSVTRDTPDEEEVWADTKAVLAEALDKYCEMRSIEGARLKEDLVSRLDMIEKTVVDIESQSVTRLERYREKLFSRMKTVLDDTNIDESRILLEAAIYADKSAIDEETVRLHSHLLQFRDIIQAVEPVGRKLDFLIQEINREVNTIGSKANDLDITASVVDVKAEVEKIREQVQNIE